MSTTFSLVVYVKPPQARPKRPSAIRIIPSVLFTAASFGGGSQAGTAQSDQCPQAELRALRREAVYFTSRIFLQFGRLSFGLCRRVSRFGLWPPGWGRS